METKKLLKKIKEVIAKNEEIRKLKKESFNIFSILRKESDEEHLHSAFIFELLNPKSSHDLGNVFLEKFLKRFAKDFSKNNKIDDFQVIKEFDIGNGRIDILIRSKNNYVIAIENKIYAEDQNTQLCRYHSYLKSRSRDDFKLLYLNLWGNAPSEISIKCENEKKIEEDKDFTILSYRKDIIEWLEDCIKETYNYPTLRETILQYINLIKKLTNQLTDNKMKEELKNLIKENYNEAKLVADQIQEVEKDTVFEFFKDLKKELTEKFPENDGWQVELDNLGERYTGISLKNEKWDSDIGIGIEGQPYVDKSVSVIGIYGNKDKLPQEKYKDAIKDKLKKFDLNKSSNSWVLYKYIYDFKNKKQLFDKDKRQELLDKYINLFENIKKEVNNDFINLKTNQL